jgi:hypothetical protein
VVKREDSPILKSKSKRKRVVIDSDDEGGVVSRESVTVPVEMGGGHKNGSNDTPPATPNGSEAMPSATPLVASGNGTTTPLSVAGSSTNGLTPNTPPRRATGEPGKVPWISM